MSTKQQSTKNGQVEKVYSISGQAPSPSKDFLELIIGKEQVIWRHWKISYKHHKKILPSEERLTHEEFKADGKIHREVVKNFGEDVLHTALGYASKEWLPRLPKATLLRITSYLDVNDICRLSQVCDTLRIRCHDNQIWKAAFLRTFGAWDELRERRATRLTWRRVFIEEWERQRVKKIDWDSL